MNKRLFRADAPVADLFTLLDRICEKTSRYFVLDVTAFNKLKYHGLYADFADRVRVEYMPRQKFYADRPLTFRSFSNMVRQICRAGGVPVDSHQTYYNAVHMVEMRVYYTPGPDASLPAP
jgi:hypothetical protein